MWNVRSRLQLLGTSVVKPMPSHLNDLPYSVRWREWQQLAVGTWRITMNKRGSDGITDVNAVAGRDRLSVAKIVRGCSRSWSSDMWSCRSWKLRGWPPGRSCVRRYGILLLTEDCNSRLNGLGLQPPSPSAFIFSVLGVPINTVQSISTQAQSTVEKQMQLPRKFPRNPMTQREVSEK